MKGLLFKDFYVLIKECRSILFMIFIMMLLTLGNDNMFWLFYPSVLAGTLPVTLCSLDERDRWTILSRTLPYSDFQLVSSKYIFGLLCSVAATALNLGFFAVRLTVKGGLSAEKILPVAVFGVAVGLLSGSISLPFIFRFGAEKGRIFYLVSIGVICAVGTIFAGTEIGGFDDSMFAFKTIQYIAVLVFIAVLYTASCLLSAALYKQREF